METRKIALILPGIGYKINKPLLYYSCKIIKKLGYTPVEVQYEEMPRIRPEYDSETMETCISIGLDSARRIVDEMKLTPEDDMIIIGKSIGTAIGSKIAEEYKGQAKCVWFTPVRETFINRRWMTGIVFHGTKDPWMDNEPVRRICAELSLPLYETIDANHSLETGEAIRDIEELGKIMKMVLEYLEK